MFSAPFAEDDIAIEKHLLKGAGLPKEREARVNARTPFESS